MLTWISLIALVAQAGFGAVVGSAVTAQPSVRITSPLGRTGTYGSIRIVAQITCPASLQLGPVRFYVDGQLLQTDSDGAPYAVEWTDENPFERREISVAVADALGHEISDRVVLEPFDIVEEAQVTSVLVEASVQDKRGRFVKSLPPSAFSVLEDGVPQTLDQARYEPVGATFALLIDSSGSMSRRLDFVQRTAAALADYMSPLDRSLVAPFSKGLLAMTGPTDDRATVADAIRAIRSSGGTAILDSLVQLSRRFPEDATRRAVILITDGYDENSTATVDETLTALKAARATVYAVAIGGVAGVSLKGEKVLRRITAETGGRTFLPATENQLQVVHAALADEVQNRYLLTYTPDNQTQDGKWREISVRLPDSDYRIVARPGYFAPRPAPIRPTLEFTATGGAGAYLTVGAEDVEVFENGVRQSIESFHEASQPMSIVLALDASGSMRHRESEVIASAHAFAAALRPQDQLGILLFSDTTALVQDLSTDRNATRAAIDTYTTAGGTALFDAVADALARLETAEGRRVVVTMTDGRDENNPGTAPGSRRSLDDVLRAVKAGGATMYSIGLGSNVDARALRQFAELSGGRTLLPQDVSQLPAEFQRVIDDLGRRYVIGYTSSNPEHDGQWRHVDIRVTGAPLVSVHSSGGYIAPGRER
jgi:Ca-activated chloride channel family protein